MSAWKFGNLLDSGDISDMKSHAQEDDEAVRFRL